MVIIKINFALLYYSLPHPWASQWCKKKVKTWADSECARPPDPDRHDDDEDNHDNDEYDDEYDAGDDLVKNPAMHAHDSDDDDDNLDDDDE